MCYDFCFYYIVLCSVSKDYTISFFKRLDYNLDGKSFLLKKYMLLSLLLLTPLIGIFIISTSMSYELSPLIVKRIKIIALSTSIVNLFISLIIFLLETLLLAVFLVLDILLFYIFFESILPPLFLLIGIFGSTNKVRASFYLFLYTLLGSLFLLLSILAMSSIMGTTDFDALYKTNFNYSTQLLLFYVILISFAVKTPTIFLNT